MLGVILRAIYNHNIFIVQLLLNWGSTQYIHMDFFFLLVAFFFVVGSAYRVQVLGPGFFVAVFGIQELLGGLALMHASQGINLLGLSRE